MPLEWFRWKKIGKKKRNERFIKGGCMMWCTNMNKGKIVLFLVYVGSYKFSHSFMILGLFHLKKKTVEKGIRNEGKIKGNFHLYLLILYYCQCHVEINYLFCSN